MALNIHFICVFKVGIFKVYGCVPIIICVDFSLTEDEMSPTAAEPTEKPTKKSNAKPAAKPTENPAGKPDDSSAAPPSVTAETGAIPKSKFKASKQRGFR